MSGGMYRADVHHDTFFGQLGGLCGDIGPVSTHRIKPGKAIKIGFCCAACGVELL